MDRAIELWDAISEGAGLDVKLYDHGFLLELADTLGVDAIDFRNELERRSVSAQALLEAVCRLIAPYATMVRDILAFFARAGARASSTNLRVRFDFDAAGHSFDFDLANFRDWESRFREVIQQTAVDEIDEFLALQLRHAFLAHGVTYDVVNSTWMDRNVPQESIARWLAGVDASLGALPPPPAVGDLELQSLLARVWTILRSMLLRTANEPIFSRDDVRSIVRGAYLLREREALLLEQLRPIFAEMPTRNIETWTLLEELLEVFNLPVWRRRAELYSVWVGVQLMTALGDATRVHVVDNTLVFAFAGSHLATVRLASGENLHVWCELRTEATAGVVGKGRKQRIQPDYVIRREPISHPNAASLVVECKQYLKQNRKGFANALIDYARNHEKAVIALVNYGPMTPSVLDEVAVTNSELLPRTHIIGTLRPGAVDVIREFERLVHSALPAAEPTVVVMPEPESSGEPPSVRVAHGAVTLSWIGAADLDVHCWVTDALGNREHVYYERPTATIGGAVVSLDRDVRTAGEAETLTWENADELTLDYAIYVYSPGIGILATKPTAEVSASGGRFILRPPRGQDGRWWTLFRIERGVPSIRIWNSVASAPLHE